CLNNFYFKILSNFWGSLHPSGVAAFCFPSGKSRTSHDTGGPLLERRLKKNGKSVILICNRLVIPGATPAF
ncbi:MAG: hypothetical protein ACLTWO_04255, partial [Blautia massiliensis (ex Durand et al. 2017)]